MLPIASFGAVSLVALTAVVIVSFPRYLVYELLLLDVTPFDSSQRQITGAACIVCCSALLLIAPTLLILSGPVRAAFLALAVWLLGLLVLDGLRYASFATDRHHLAARADFLWLVITSVGLLVARLQNSASVFLLVSLWFGGAAVASALELILRRVVPNLREGWNVIQEKKGLSLPYLQEFGSAYGFNTILIYGLSIIVGFEAAGSVRAAHLLFGPLTILMVGVYPFAIRLAASESRQGLRITQVAIAVSTAATLFGLLLLAWLITLTDEWGSRLVGDSWAGTKPIILLVGVVLLGEAIGSGAKVGLRSVHRQRENARVRMRYGGVGTLLALCVATRWGLQSALAVSALSSLSIALATWSQVLKVGAPVCTPDELVMG